MDITKDHSNLLQKKDGKASQNILWLGTTPFMIFDKGTHFYLTDNLGSPIRLMGDGQAISEDYVYDEFGNDLISEGSKHIQPLGFTGHIGNTISNGYSTRERLYIPSMGRFAAEDIIGGIVDDPRTINRYNYCFGSPIRFVDRDGAFPIVGDISKEAVQDAAREYGPEIAGGVADRVAEKPVLDRLGSARDYSENKPISDTAAYLAKTKAGKGAISILLHMNRDKNGVYYTRQNCWQQYVGYTDSYDEYFKGFTSAKPTRLPSFNHKGETYTLWAWKGDYYGLGAGAETGIYTGSGTYKKCHTDSKLIMGLSLYNKSGCQILTRPKERHWWITGFNPDFQDVTHAEITGYVSIDFSQYTKNGKNEFWDAFLNQYTVEMRKRYGMCIDVDNKTVYIKI